MQPTSDNPHAGDVELVPGTGVGGYLVESKLGEGGMGVVYGALHPPSGNRVAIKVLAGKFCRDPSTVSRFEQEARLVTEIHHRNIVDIYDVGQIPDGRKYLVMERLDGESLSDRIERGPIPPAEAAAILDAVCDALEAVHARGVVHRDLKSDNVFLPRTGEPRVKLLDFGLAKLAANDPRAITKTKTGIVVGTPHYMAPEQARGKPVDNRTDIYALGVLAHKMLTGRLPFVGEPIELLIQHLKTPAPSPAALVPGLPDALCQVVMRMMAKYPEERPSLADMRAVFGAIRDGRAPDALPAPATRSGSAAQSAADLPAPPRKSRTVHVVLGVVALLLAATVSFLVVRMVTRDNGEPPAATP